MDKKTQKKRNELLDAIEAHCDQECASPSTSSADYPWKRAAASAAADAYCLREGTMPAAIHATFQGGEGLFQLTAAQRK
jgi:hypothetical protein